MTTSDAATLVGDLVGAGEAINCARPLATAALPGVAESADASLRVARLYHGSVVDGPGRRSVVQLQGCPLHCPGCYVPETHDREGGVSLPVATVVAALLDPAGQPRDGVTVLGGEPFAQPAGLLALVRALRARGCSHILVYSGYTYEALRRGARRQPTIAGVLRAVDVLVDGPYVVAQAAHAGPWTGSGDQRVIDLVASRRAGHAVMLRSAR